MSLLEGEGRREEGAPGPAWGRGSAWSPKSRARVCVLLVHAQGSQHRWNKEPVPVTSAFYYPEICHREMELAIRGCQEWGRRDASGVNRGENRCFWLIYRAELLP